MSLLLSAVVSVCHQIHPSSGIIRHAAVEQARPESSSHSGRLDEISGVPLCCDDIMMGSDRLSNLCLPSHAEPPTNICLLPCESLSAVWNIINSCAALGYYGSAAIMTCDRSTCSFSSQTVSIPVLFFYDNETRALWLVWLSRIGEVKYHVLQRAWWAGAADALQSLSLDAFTRKVRAKLSE